MAAAVVVAAIVRRPLAQEPMRSPAPPKGATLRRGRRHRLQAGYVLLHRPPPKQQSSKERAAADSLYCSAREVKADKTSLNTVKPSWLGGGGRTRTQPRRDRSSARPNIGPRRSEMISIGTRGVLLYPVTAISAASPR